jgi:elongation factor P
MLDFTDIKLGKVVTYQSAPCVITKCEFLRMQQRKPVKKCILKNLLTGSNVEYSFKSGESIEEAEMKRARATYMYSTNEEVSFMLIDTYETVEIDASMLGGKEGYLTEGLRVEILYYNDQPIAVDIPIKVTLTVTNTTDAIKGNTVSDVNKDAIVETGITVKVPAFVKIGDKVIFNTVEDEYVGRES